MDSIVFIIQKKINLVWCGWTQNRLFKKEDLITPQSNKQKTFSKKLFKELYAVKWCDHDWRNSDRNGAESGKFNGSWDCQNLHNSTRMSIDDIFTINNSHAYFEFELIIVRQKRLPTNNVWGTFLNLNLWNWFAFPLTFAFIDLRE